MLKGSFEYGDTVSIINDNYVKCDMLNVGKIKTIISGQYVLNGFYTLEICEKVNCGEGSKCGFKSAELLVTRMVLIERIKR